MTVFTVTADTIFVIAPLLNLSLSGLWPQPSVTGDRGIGDRLLTPSIPAFVGGMADGAGDRASLVSPPSLSLN
ncbi:MAG: hypothetical protein AAFO87_11010 [Cyanobacteria bacterium J06607_6]